MKLIEPQAIRLLSSTMPENDAPAWSAGTAYEIGDSVIHEHRVYKAVTASTGKQPDQHCEGTDAGVAAHGADKPLRHARPVRVHADGRG